MWLSFGVYTLDPGEAAVLLRLGTHVDTVRDPGVHWTLPPPIVTREIVNVGMVRNEDFGVPGPGETAEADALVHEASMQTSDNNIVRVSFTVQYRIGDRLRGALPRRRSARRWCASAAAAAMREVVGRMTVDGVLRERRAALTSEVLDDCSRASSTATSKGRSRSTPSSSRTCRRRRPCARRSTTWSRRRRTRAGS